METDRAEAGARRTVPVASTGALGGGSPVTLLWACERYDGQLWQLVAMAANDDERRAFLRGE